MTTSLVVSFFPLQSTLALRTPRYYGPLIMRTTISKQRGYQARVTQGAPFCHDRTIIGKHEARGGACLIRTQDRFCTTWTLEPVLAFAFICFYVCQVELLVASNCKSTPR